MEQHELISLLQASTFLSGIVLSCTDRKNYPFTKTQMNIFTVLDMEGDLSMKKIAQLLATSQEQATRTVAPLADAGYVQRITDPANRTRVYIHLTESGRQVIEDSRKALIAKLSEKLDQSITEEDKTALCRACTEIVGLLDKVNY